MKLTARETQVLDALKRSGRSNGGDFAFVEDVLQQAPALELTGQQIGALLTTLQTKGVIEVHEPITTDSGTWTQVTSDRFREADV